MCVVVASDFSTAFFVTIVYIFLTVTCMKKKVCLVLTLFLVLLWKNKPFNADHKWKMPVRQALIYTHVYTRVRTHVYICVYAYICTHVVHTCCAHICLNTCLQTCRHTCLHLYLRTCLQKMSTHMSTYMSRHMFTHISTHMSTHVYTCLHNCLHTCLHALLHKRPYQLGRHLLSVLEHKYRNVCRHVLGHASPAGDSDLHNHVRDDGDVNRVEPPDDPRRIASCGATHDGARVL